jgi:hypothetical protein
MKKIIAILVLFSSIALAVGGGGGGGGGSPAPDPCLGVVCNSPPATYCSSGIQVTYSSSGNCNSVTGQCSYPFTTTNCQYGCDVTQCKAPVQQQTQPQVQNQSPPAAPEPSRTFACFDHSTIEERVKCRLNLDEGERAYELKVQFLPEECRALFGAQRDECIKVYDNVQRCWMFPEGASRVGCVRDSLDFTSIASESTNCESATNKTECIDRLKKNVFSLIKFRIYDLEERAEELHREYPYLVAKFVTDLEKKKQEFNDAATIAGKRQVILGVRELWKNFVAEVKA